MNRLLIRIPLATDQAVVANQLMAMEGLCACGRVLKWSDPKFILCNLVTGMAPDPKDRNTLIIGAYCLPCSITINKALKDCRKIAYSERTETREVNHAPS